MKKNDINTNSETILTSSIILEPRNSRKNSEINDSPAKDTTLKMAETYSNKKQIFEVHHKNEKITVFINEEKNKYRTLYKCVYCQQIFYSINRFDSHMRKHVSKTNFYLILILLFRLEKNLLSVNIANGHFLKRLI